MISVVLPVHNGERTIGAAVRSTLAFLPRRSELLIHSDGSTDHTLRVLRSINDPRLSVSFGDSKIGVAASLNGLIQRAQYDWVARMDADDLTLPGRFRAQMLAAREGYDLVFAHRINFGYRPGSFRQTRGARIESGALKLMMLFENPLVHPTLLARRSSLLLDGGYRAGPAEDYDLWMRLQCRAVRMVSIARPVIAYRKHPHQVSQASDYSADFRRDVRLAAAYRALATDLQAPDFLARAEVTPSIVQMSEDELGSLTTFLDERAAEFGDVQAGIVRAHLRQATLYPHHSRLLADE